MTINSSVCTNKSITMFKYFGNNSMLHIKLRPQVKFCFIYISQYYMNSYDKYDSDEEKC